MHSHSSSKPVSARRATPLLFGQDFQATCRHVADLLADDLKSQMSGE